MKKKIILTIYYSILWPSEALIALNLFLFFFLQMNKKTQKMRMSALLIVDCLNKKKRIFLVSIVFPFSAHLESYGLNILKCFHFFSLCVCLCMYRLSSFVVKLRQNIKKILAFYLLFCFIQLLWTVKSINFFLTTFDVVCWFS